MLKSGSCPSRLLVSLQNAHRGMQTSTFAQPQIFCSDFIAASHHDIEKERSARHVDLGRVDKGDDRWMWSFLRVDWSNETRHTGSGFGSGSVQVRAWANPNLKIGSGSTKLPNPTPNL